MLVVVLVTGVGVVAVVPVKAPAAVEVDPAAESERCRLTVLPPQPIDFPRVYVSVRV